MIKSMTGYGQSVLTLDNLSISLELRSYNSKFLDLSLKLPKEVNGIEAELRSRVSEALQRGKIVFAIEILENQAERKSLLDEELFCHYYFELKKLADKVMSPYEPLFEIAMKATEIEIERKVHTVAHVSDQILILVNEVVDKCDAFRINEGKMMYEKLKSYILEIEKGLEKVKSLDPIRIEKLKLKTKNNIAEFLGEKLLDSNRFEQEFFYFIEKMDIQEECTRLQSHIDYFLSTLESNVSNGKKLSFVSQELGREINTIGAKANDAEMQIAVVLMKEELEKIKEQLNNVL